MKRFKLLQQAEFKSVEDQSHESPKQLFLAQFDRFELWAVNLGVFVMGHGSLDYRIRDSATLAYLHGDIEQEDEDEDTDSCSDMESDMDLLLDSLKDPIDRLYKMAVWIRNPATRITSTKARNLQQIDEETNVDLFESFKKFDYEHISSLFLEYEKHKAIQENPIAKAHDTVGNDETVFEDQVWEPTRKTLEPNKMEISNSKESYLVLRIAQANGIRRQQFAYWRKHKNKLREHAAVVVEVPTHNLPTTSHIIQLEDKNEKVKAPLTVTTATQLRPSHEIGNEFGKENVMTLAVSEYAPSAWNPSKDIVSFPPAPKISTGIEFFECPYCYTICPASILSEKAWRAHLIRDLRPYICTFEHCLNSEQLYDSRDDWIEHETSTHQTVFRCPLHEEETFITLATYEEHTQKYHDEDAIPLGFATSTATNIHRSCPICSVVLGTTQNLQSHIALHLERFAMFSLPRCIDDNNDGSSGGRSSSALFDSNRSFNEDPDGESNAAGRDEEPNTTHVAIMNLIRTYIHDVAMLRSLSYTELYRKEKGDADFLEKMAQSRDELSSCGEVIRAWTPNDTVNNLLFEFGEACMGSGLVEEAIETLEHLKLIQSGQPEHDEPALLRTKQLLATAYQVKEAIQEVEELSRDDPNLYDKPINTKVRHIFARTEAGKRHAETIWGPSIWKTRPSQNELKQGDDVDSFSSRSFDGGPLSIPFTKQEEFPPLAQNEDGRPEEVHTQALSQAQHQSQGPPQAYDNAALRGQLYNHARLVYNRLMTEAAYQYSGSENIPQDTVDRIIQQSYVQAKQSVRDSVRRQAQQQQRIISEESNYNTPHAGQDLETPEDIPGFDNRRFIELMEQLFEETDVDENHILSEDNHASHGGQNLSRADHDRRVPMDPPDIGEFASERYFEKLRQLQTDHQQTNDDESNATTMATASEFILPLRDSSSPTDEKPQPSARGKKRFLSLRQKAAAHATHRLSSVDIIAEQEAAGIPYLFRKEDNEMRGGGHDSEGEIGVLREMFRVLVEESQAEFEQAPEGTELKLEAQTLARTLAQQTTLYMLDVEELKIQHFGATNILERNEKGRAWINKVRSYDFGGMRDMIKEIQKKREAEEARRAEAARERNEKQAQSEKRLLLKMEEANKELLEHEERMERHKQALEAIYAKRGLEDSSAAPPELEARDASTEVPTRTEVSKSELNTHKEEIAAEDEKIRDAIEKLVALKQELRRVQAEKEVQVPSSSESQKAQSRGSKTTWQCCQCGTGDLEFHVDYYCTEHDCRHPFCQNCLINFRH
ncbi:hypothetical protein A0O28_0045210 [Trichoderma guizhouense]|uniref:C2H2-type domain-containing protein n=1 Tax=Trichoderma guizhouense TaxID=1491466 RepID=A0A1T3C981_9HYPO|nr:hypothetical protein A0O28_0045210 [Trichoderma guizhouense]